jgi:uncharacterized protein (TIGR03083 family)
VNHLEDCDALEIEIDRFATVMAEVPGDTSVESCPGWTIDDMACHLGSIHRWADELVRTRSRERIAVTRWSSSDFAVTPEWIREGGSGLLATLRDADAHDAMWSWGRDQHVRFWSRRQLHETLVHRMDAELAGHKVPNAEPVIASDAIDEFLTNLEKVVRASRDSPLRGEGECLLVRASDTDQVWSLTLVDDGFDLSHEGATSAVTIEGPSSDLLLTICRRLTPAQSHVKVDGDAGLLDYWLANTAFD